jgi:hypothetical protein
MHTFFHGWRRKTGCITLVVSCALMGLWMRSQLAGDTWCWSVGHETEVVISENGMLSWWRLATQRPVARFWNPGFVGRTSDGTRYAAIGDWGAWFVRLNDGPLLAVRDPPDAALRLPDTLEAAEARSRTDANLVFVGWASSPSPWLLVLWSAS